MEDYQESSQLNTPEFDSTKDYHHFYPNPGFVKSLQVICLEGVANHVMGNLDPWDPLSQESQIQEIFDSIENLGFSKDCLLQLCTSKLVTKNKITEDGPVTTFSTVVKLDKKLWFYLAIEKAMNEGKIAHLMHFRDDMRWGSRLPLISMDCMYHYLKEINRQEIAEKFIQKYIQPLVDANESLDSVMTQEIFDGYDQQTTQIIYDDMKLILANWFLNHVTHCNELRGKLEYLDHHLTDYLRIFDDSLPINTFNNLVEEYRHNLFALEEIKKLGIEDKFKKMAIDPNRIHGVSKRIFKIKRKIVDILGSDSPSRFYTKVSKKLACEKTYKLLDDIPKTEMPLKNVPSAKNLFGSAASVFQ